MAKHLTWCLKRMFLMTNRLMVNRQSMTILKYSNIIEPKIFPQLNKINVDYDEPKDFSEFVEESKHGKNTAITTLMKILSVTRENATKAVEQYPTFKVLQKKTILKNFQILRESGVYKSTIKDNKFLLTDTTGDLKKKIEIIEKIDININDSVGLFHLSTEVLTIFERRLRMEASYLPACNRIQYLAEKLDCCVSKICYLMSYYPILLHLPAPTLLSITELFLESGMAPHHILNDPNAYTYSIGNIIEKIKLAREVGVSPLKPWILRCNDQIWEKVKEKYTDHKITLKPNQNRYELLSEIFECDVEMAEFLFIKNPQYLTINIYKLTTMARLLHNEGYMIDDIIRSPRIFYRRIETVMELIEEWRKSGAPKPHLFKFLLEKEKFKKTLIRSVVPKEPES